MLNVALQLLLAATKYIHKGHDRAKINIQKVDDVTTKEEEIHDEIKSFVDTKDTSDLQKLLGEY